MPRLLLVMIAVLLALPAAAQAGGTAAVDGNRLVVTGTPGADKMAIEKLPSTGEMIVGPRGLEPGVGATTPGPGCRRDTSTGAEKLFCAAGVTEVTVDLGAGDDELTFILSDVSRRVDLGDGDDWVEDISGGAVIALGDGDDEARAGAKPTAVEAGAGNDNVFCKDGSSATRSKGARTVDGGAGRDRICGGIGDDDIDGGVGDDKVYAGEGEDTLDGDAGDDLLEGGDDNDRITGGRGEDEVDGGSGRDEIRVRDREVDDVACGSRRDTVTADRSDDLFRCETVRLG